MQQTGTTAPLTRTIGPKCSFPDRVLEISTLQKLISLKQKHLSASHHRQRTSQNALFYDRVLIPFPGTPPKQAAAKLGRNPQHTMPSKPPSTRLTPSSIGNIVTGNINARRVTKMHLAVGAGAGYHFEVAHRNSSFLQRLSVRP